MSALAALTSSGIVQTVPQGADGWRGAKVWLQGTEWRIRTADGKDTARISVSPSGRGYEKHLVVSNADDALVIDAREACRQGASHLFFYPGNIDLGPIAGGDAIAATEWSGDSYAAVSVLLEGQDAERHHWWRAGKVRITDRRRVTRHAHTLPADLRSLHWRLDINAPGRKGPIVFHRARIAPLAELAVRRPTCPQPELLFRASFDGTADAEVAWGGGHPLVATNFAFAAGRVGQAARFTEKGRPRLAYAAKGNVNPACGAIGFWYKREWPERERLGWRDGAKNRDIWRRMFSLPGAKRPGAGGLCLWWWHESLCCERGDFDRTRASQYLLMRSLDDGWHHYVISWDDCGTRFYVDGHLFPKGAKSDSYSPQREALKDLNLLEFDRDDAAFSKFFVGSDNGGYGVDGLMDEFCIWSAPLDAKAVLAEYNRFVEAAVETDEHYALEGATKTIRVTVTSPNGTNLSGRRPLLVDAAGKTVAAGSPLMQATGVCEIAAPGLPKGEYRVTFGEASEPYWVLGADNPVELPPGRLAGVPVGAKRVATIKPDLATLKPDGFRAVGECRMGALGDVAYLEAGPNPGDRFAIRLAFETNCPLHCIEIDYPDDGDRTADIIIQKCQQANSDYTLQVGYFCGGKEMKPTGRMKTHRCLYWTSVADAALVVMTARKNSPAAVSEIRVYQVPSGALPSAGVVDAEPVDGWGRHFASYWEDPAINYDFACNESSAAGFDLQINRKMALMKYCGQDMLVYPGAWYHGLIAHDLYNPRRHARHFLQAWYEKFDRAGLGLMPTVNQQTIPFDGRLVTRETMRDGSLHPTEIALWDTGTPSWGGWHGQPPNFNIHHPNVQAEFVRIIRALVAEGRVHPSFRGVCLHLTSITCPWWGGITSGYNDYTIAAFERETGVKVPGDRRDPLRAKAYAAFLKTQAYDQWVDWRCRKLTDFYVQLAKILSDARGDLRLFVNAMPTDGPKEPDFMQEGMCLRRLREAGIDPEMLTRRIPNLILGKTLAPCYWRHGLLRSQFAPERRERAYNLPFLKEAYPQLETSAYGWVNQHDQYWESPIGAGKTGKDILTCDWMTEAPWRVTTLNMSGRNCLRFYALPLKFNDVMAFSRGGFLIGVYGMEPHMAAFAKAFRALPAVKFADVATDNPDVTVRTREWRGRTYLYAVNTSETDQTVRVKLPSGIRDLVSGEEPGEGEISLRLLPYQLRSFATEKR